MAKRKAGGAPEVAEDFGLKVNEVALAWGLTRKCICEMNDNYPHRFKIVCAGIKALSEKK
ncbi:hypothetical protein [Shewanella sp.]|uniref:hypothetical protein n=1 Tax=Shewanella sp. TaxID=50422 RepID=UPI003F3B5E3C